MKKRLLLVISILLCNISIVYAFKTYTENVNPFNRFLNPIDGVDLYTGSASFTKTLYTMKGRNGLDIGINLKYSSNVYVNVRTRNDVAPTGWLGLGWNLSYGSIKCNHKGTSSPTDDEFTWESPEGHLRRMFVEFSLDDSLRARTNPVCFIKEMPYVKVKCNYDSANNVIKGWTVIKIDGTKLSYGNLESENDSIREATRYTLKCSTYVEPLIRPHSTKEYELYPYQWDLSDIEDNFGNHLVFKYWQDKEKIKSREWNSTDTAKDSTDNLYTKSSYVKEIINPEGKRIVFKTVLKDSNEYYDPYKFDIEPDAFIERINRHLLDSVIIYNSNNNLIKVFTFKYHTINQELPSNFLKSLLDTIAEYNYKGNIFNQDVFAYFDNIKKGDEDSTNHYSADYNYGALKNHRDRKGFFVAYEYERAVLAQETKTVLDTFETDSANLYRADIAIGRMSNGKYPFGVLTTPTKCFVFTWDGSKWVGDSIDVHDSIKITDLYLDATHRDTNMIAVAGNDYFALLGGPHDNRKLCVYNWNEYDEEWQRDKSLDGADTSGIVTIGDAKQSGWEYYNRHVQIFGATDYFIISRRNYQESYVTYVSIWNRFNCGSTKWKRTLLDQGYRKFVEDLDGPARPLDIQIASNFVVILEAPSPVKILTLNWNGFKWVQHDIVSNGFGRETTIRVNRDFIEFNYNLTDPYRSRIYRLDGNSWLLTYNQEDRKNKVYYSWIPKINISANHNITLEDQVNKIWKVKSWNGYNWDLSINMDTLSKYDLDNDRCKSILLTDKFAVFKYDPSSEYDTTQRRLEWDNNTNEWMLLRNSSNNPIMYSNPVSWNMDDYQTYGPIAHVQNDFFISTKKEESDMNNDEKQAFDADVHVWNGVKWQEPYGANTNNLLWKTVVDAKTTSDAIIFLHEDFSGGNKARVSLHYKFQNRFDDTIYTYTLKEKIFKPGFGQESEKIEYIYDDESESRCFICQGQYDTKNGTAKFKEVSVKLQNNVKKTYHFFNDDDSQITTDSTYKKLDGLVFAVENYDSSGILIPSADTNSYDIYKNDNWLSGVYHRRTTNKIVTLDRVITDIKSNYDLNTGALDINGLPRFSYVKNSNGSIITEYTLFAHEQSEYDTLADSSINILNQPCLKIVLENFDPDSLTLDTLWYDTISSDTIRSARAITWAKNHNPDSIWAPSAVYVWDVKKDNTGKPDDDFHALDFSSPGSDTSWKYVSEISEYNKYGQVLETKRLANGTDTLYSSRIYRNDFAHSLAEVINAEYEACAFFTCDYDMDTLVSSIKYFDYENKWEKANSFDSLRLEDSLSHFGQRSLYVKNSKGPIKKIYGIDKNRDYVFSAWVRPRNNTGPITLGAFINGSGNNLGVVKDSLNQNEWQLIYHTIPKDSLSSFTPGSDYIEIWIGNDGGTASDFYVDDIRFYPYRSFVTTTYYDNLWEKPIVSVDANNNPGARIDYDKHKAITKNAMMEDDFGSLKSEGSALNFVGQISFHPTDNMKTNLYYDDIWQKPKVFMADNSPAGKIIYDDFGRPEKWYNMAHNNLDTLLINKNYHFSGFLHNLKIGCDTTNLIPIDSLNIKGDNVYFDSTEVTISCDSSVQYKGSTYSFTKWNVYEGNCGNCIEDDSTHSTKVTMPKNDLEIKALYTKQQ